MSNQDKGFKRLSLWNMMLVIFGSLGGIIGIMALPALLDATKQIKQVNESINKVNDPELIKTMEKTLELMITPLYRGYSLVILVLSLVLLTAFVQNIKKIKEKQSPTLWPYYLHLGKIVLAIFVSFLTGGLALTNSLVISTVLLNLGWAIPAIIIIKTVNKMKKAE